MPGPAPKHPSTRARRNKSATRATLSAPTSGKAPEMPAAPPVYYEDSEGVRHREDVDWHPMAVRWWSDVWSAPMSTEWHESDVHNVLICLLLQQDMWTASSPKERAAAQAEYRLQRKDLGLTPMDRRRLEWTIESAEEAKDKGAQRRARKQPEAPSPAPGGKKDPRATLHAVS